MQANNDIRFLECDIGLSLAVGFTFCFFFNYALTVNPFTLYGGYDQSIFEQVGLGMLQGRIPYVDLFDHKGFLLYVINAVGLWISAGHTGLYVLLSLYLSATFLCWLHISDNIVNPSLRYIPALITLLFVCLCEGGNMTETWSLFAISLPIYYLVRYLCKQQSIKYRECFFIGVCMGIAANMRLNNIVPAFTVCLYMFFDLCYRKSFLKLTYSMITVISGFCVITMTLVVLYIGLYGTQFLKDYWFCNIVFNIIYVDHFTHKPLWQAAPFYFPFLMLVMMFCNTRSFLNKLSWFTLVAFILTLITTGTAYFSHYFTLFAPIILLSISLSIGKSISVSPCTWRYTEIGTLIILIVFLCFFHKGIIQMSNSYITREKAISECCNKLNMLTKKQKDSIWNYNAMMAGANILQCSGLVQCNRIFLPFQVDEQYGVTEIGKLRDIRPEVILVDENTQWGKEYSVNALESIGNYNDSVFIAQNYQILHRCRTLIHNKRVCILVRDHDVREIYKK